MKTTRMQKLIAGCSFLFLFLPGLQAEEGGAAQYAPGSFASFMDALPSKPGFAAFNYFVYYNGDAGVSRTIPIAGQIGVNVDATTYADSFGGFYITPLKVFGGNYAAGVAIPFMWNTVSAQVTLPGGGTVSRKDSANGLGDVEFWPVAISWGPLSNDLHVTFYGGIFAPTGDFQLNRLANQGLGYWTFEPGVMVSYLGQQNGFEASAYIGYDINTENPDTDYRSGQVFHLDATVAQHLPLGPGFIGIGATGFYLQQTTGDSGSGATLGNFEERSAGVGPVLSYAAQFGKTGFAASVKWLPQVAARNTVKGDYIWFKLGVSF